MALDGRNSFALAGSFLTGATVPNVAGGSNGAAVSTSVSFADHFGVGRLPPTYVVAVAPNQAAMVWVSNKSATGFTVTLTPLSGVTLAAGFFDVTVLA